MSRNECIICGEGNFKPAYKVRDFHYGVTSKEFEAKKCENCGVFCLSPMMTTKELMPLYPETYYSYSEVKVPSNLRLLINNIICKK